MQTKANRFRGCPNITMIWNGTNSDPELMNDATGHIANYWDIEDAIWQYFLDETGHKDSDDCEDEFNAFCVAHEYSIQEDIEVWSGHLEL